MNEERNELNRAFGSDLLVGTVVELKYGGRIEIAHIQYGDSEAVDATNFYRWNREFPYNIEHAAMDDERHMIVEVFQNGTVCNE
tara:strand:+ start:1268 stop:1519 length:252 start_codon:yes stop_codon:yes gene_type:complete